MPSCAPSAGGLRGRAMPRTLRTTALALLALALGLLDGALAAGLVR